MTEPPAESLATAILETYQAPLEDFISRRDALVKQLRAEKRSDDAARVKALRKPSRMAWALDGVVREDPASIERLAAAIGVAQAGTDLQIAFERLKEAVRDVAAAGARVAVRRGHPIEPSALVAAVHAIIGDASAFAEFRAGRLADVPQGGGLDLLVALQASPVRAKPSSPPAVAPPVPEPARTDPRVELAAAARAELARAERVLTEVRKQSEGAVESVRSAEAEYGVAEHALRRAQSELESRRDQVQRARRHAESASANLDAAERAVEDARARAGELE